MTIVELAPPTHNEIASVPPIEHAVDRVIALMEQDLTCERGIGDLADQVHYSKFHFTREFTRITGTNPRRFLSALRMNRAKELIRTTDRSVTEITHMVGFTSVGTFSDRFRQLVGQSPSHWRRSTSTDDIPRPFGDVGGTECHGMLELPDGAPSLTCYVAAFSDSIIQGRPAAATMIAGSGEFVLRNLPRRHWTITVTCFDEGTGPGTTCGFYPWSPESDGAPVLLGAHYRRTIDAPRVLGRL